MPIVLIPPTRLPRWVENFATRHGGVTLAAGHDLFGTSPDGSTFSARLPLGMSYDGPAVVQGFAAAAVAPDCWGVLLVRKGGFAVARLAGPNLVEHKVGRRHVQGRTKAGGQSQQRFARRRDNQARQAAEAAAEHAVRILRPGPLVTGGDRIAVAEVLADPRLRGLVVVDPWLPVPDPRRQVLDGAVLDAQAVRIDVTNSR